jgi:hypothetical protein
MKSRKVNRFTLLAALLLVIFVTNTAKAEGLRKRHAILKGVFYTAGGSGGNHSLTGDQIEDLCEEGFSTVYYLYPTNFSNRGINRCGSHQLNYLHTAWEGSGLRTIFARVVDVLNSGEGPVLAHCWNGRHAAGAVAAQGLIQFCGWSNERALDFWADNVGGDWRKYPHVISEINRFRPLPEFAISASQQAALCP